MTRREAILALTIPASGPHSSLLMEIRSRRILEATWPGLNEPLAFGSLMKPFVALAYGDDFPTLDCQRCWKPNGHGRLSLTGAIAYSCNSYFLNLARRLTADDVVRVSSTYGLPPPASAQPEAWIGLGDGWRVSPLELLGAFCELAMRATDPGPAAVLVGMRLSAKQGTARAIKQDAYAKTGTGPCAHRPKGTGDGYTVALFPAAAPRVALLVGLHNRPGSEAARYASLELRKPSGASGGSSW